MKIQIIEIYRKDKNYFDYLSIPFWLFVGGKKILYPDLLEDEIGKLQAQF